MAYYGLGARTGSTRLGLTHGAPSTEPSVGHPGGVTRFGIPAAMASSNLGLAPVQTLAPSGVGSAAAFGTAVVDLTIVGVGIAAGALGTPTVVPGAVVLAPAAIASAEAVPTGSISGATIRTAGAIGSSGAFGAASLSYLIRPTGVGPGAFGVPRMGLNVNPGAIASAAAVPLPSLVQIIGPDGIAGIDDTEESFGTAFIVLDFELDPSPIGSTETFGDVELVAPVPGAPIAPPRDYFRDLTTGDRYDWPINHSSQDALNLGRRLDHGAPNGSVGLVRQQGASDLVQLRLQGTFLDPDQHANLVDFYNRCRQRTLVFHHAEGDEYDVIITSYDSRREKVGVNPRHRDLDYIYRATIEMLVVDVRAGVPA